MKCKKKYYETRKSRLLKIPYNRRSKVNKFWYY